MAAVRAVHRARGLVFHIAFGLVCLGGSYCKRYAHRAPRLQAPFFDGYDNIHQRSTPGLHHTAARGSFRSMAHQSMAREGRRDQRDSASYDTAQPG